MPVLIETDEIEIVENELDVVEMADIELNVLQNNDKAINNKTVALITYAKEKFEKDSDMDIKQLRYIKNDEEATENKKILYLDDNIIFFKYNNRIIAYKK